MPFVPSIATTPSCTIPVSADSASTSPNRPASAASWRWRKRAIRHVIGPLVRVDHARGDILDAAPLDLS
jgi:hypothetical protein